MMGRLRSEATRCESCGSENLGNFTAEIAVHFPGSKNTDKPDILVFPALIVCLDCGIAEFAVPEKELRQLVRGRAAGAE
jgi:hypothetical protein